MRIHLIHVQITDIVVNVRKLMQVVMMEKQNFSWIIVILIMKYLVMERAVNIIHHVLPIIVVLMDWMNVQNDEIVVGVL